MATNPFTNQCLPFTTTRSGLLCLPFTIARFGSLLSFLFEFLLIGDPTVLTYFAGKLPENCFPLFMTSKTQEIFHCQCDADVTEENPIKIITKQEILDDMRLRAAISDFHPFKQKILVCTPWVGLVWHRCGLYAVYLGLCWLGTCVGCMLFILGYVG